MSTQRGPRIAAACLLGTTAKPQQNADRISFLSELVRTLRSLPDWHPLDAIVLPGGLFRMSKPFGATGFAQRREAVSGEQFAEAARLAIRHLYDLSPGLRLVFGVLATPRDLTERTEQSSLAFGRSGLVAAARKIFPTAQDARTGNGKRALSPFVADYSSPHRFVELPNGSTALLSACYDLFGVADIGADSAARRLAIRRLLLGGKRHITHNEAEFGAARRKCLMAWHELVQQHRPDVAIATVHSFRQPGEDGYFQRHGIAKASSALGGALVVAGAHFKNTLPQSDTSTLAAFAVPAEHLSAGLHRTAHRLLPIASHRIDPPNGQKALMRLFTAAHPLRSVSSEGGR